MRLRTIFEKERFQWRLSDYRTLLLDLTPSLELLRKGFRSNWRNHLKQAERKGLKIIEGTGDNLYEIFVRFHEEMTARKKIMHGVNINDFRAIQQDLPDPLKMRIFVCEYEGEPLSALIGSLVGNTGIYLLGATASIGLKLKGSYLLQWRMIIWLKENGAHYYDLHGFNPEEAPGVFHFKAGLGGKDVYQIGQFDACQNNLCAFFMKFGDHMRGTSRKRIIYFNRMSRAFLKRITRAR
jgi:lipid II:glycine glycyltransferase (peptidoglycan interpeptide bridge formation enzyme)